ncbi:MAG: sigma-70 family RNA polymerase sigma factor [Acidobacteriia bacterium]|nr:sigma-70 family RNA polymerase sigma factor [Terriglobia bacterium]
MGGQDDPGEVTLLLEGWRKGDPEAFNSLIPLVYDQLHRIALGLMRRERTDHTLQPTALLNELYMRLLHQRKVTWNDRAHFFTFTALVMRNILTDHARAHLAQRRGGGFDLTVSSDLAWIGSSAEELLDLNTALERLQEIDPRKARLLELRFFLSFTTEEACELLNISHATAERELKFARAWLFRELRGGAHAAQGRHHGTGS